MDKHNDNTDEIKQELAADGSPSGIEAEEYTPYPFDADKISITNQKMSLSNVIRRIKRGLIRAADIQRDENLWDKGKKSRLIESLMLKIPLPLFYVARNTDDVLTIVDGLQRISAIREYVSEDSKAKFNALEFLTEYNGKIYKNLPENMKIRIEETELDFVIIEPDSPPEVQRNIFKRLNTGGLPLTEQEIRHALYYGPATALLKELADSEEFIRATGESIKDSRMAGQEMVLRFLAFSIFGTEKYLNNNMDTFLSSAMESINSNQILIYSNRQKTKTKIVTLKKAGIDVEALKEKFKLAMTRAAKLFEDHAFRKSTPVDRSRRRPINKSLFEVWASILADMDEQQFNRLLRRRKRLYKTLNCAFKDKSSTLTKNTSTDTHSIASVTGRFEAVLKIVVEITQETNE
ncbi:MAG: DUF262 domain-containing protein [Proteobacteria bacterium]|nr:DUF262 domain-containing protein [Pseudomonadota bacterium]